MHLELSRLVLKVHDIPVEFSSAPGSWLDEVRPLYDPQLTSEPSSWRVGATAVDAIDYRPLDEQGVPCSLNAGTRDWIRTPELAGWIDYGTETADLQLRRDELAAAFGRLYHALYLRLALRARRVFVHASGVVKEGRAFLFVGPSGAGKTTISSMLEGVQVIHDDSIFLEMVGPTPHVRPAPFLGNGRFLRDRLRDGVQRFPVGAIYFLHKSARPSLEPVAPGAAFAKLLTAPLPEERPGFAEDFRGYMERALEVTQSLVAATPCYDLCFSLTELPSGLLAVGR
jgi:hypothetical protein